MPTRREFMRNTAAALAASTLPSAIGRAESPATGPQQPNVIFILTDQQEGHMIGYHRRNPIETPHLDRLAREGATFSNMFAHAPVCSPNRACLLTGRYVQQHQVLHNISRDDIDIRRGFKLRTDETTWGEAFRDAGYATGYVGKWHLCRDTHVYIPQADRHGFDYWCTNDRHQAEAYYMEGEAREPTQGEVYNTDFLTDKAISFLEQREHSARPFFLTVSYPDPHQGPAYIREPYQERTREMWPDIDLGESYRATAAKSASELNELEVALQPKVRQVVGRWLENKAHLYPQMKTPEDVFKVWHSEFLRRVELIDENVGRLIAWLEVRGMLDNTIIVFTSDHGEMAGAHRGFVKGNPYDESIRVPFFVRYPPRVHARATNALATSVDVFPTLCGLAGIQIPETVSGKSLLPVMTGEARDVYDSICCQLYDWTAVRTHEGKLITSPRLQNDYLFAYDTDPWEIENAINDAGHAGLRRDLTDEMARWSRRVL